MLTSSFLQTNNLKTVTQLASDEKKTIEFIISVNKSVLMKLTIR